LATCQQLHPYIVYYWVQIFLDEFLATGLVSGQIIGLRHQPRHFVVDRVKFHKGISVRYGSPVISRVIRFGEFGSQFPVTSGMAGLRSCAIHERRCQQEQA
jgi:hypothetical protein